MDGEQEIAAKGSDKERMDQYRAIHAEVISLSTVSDGSRVAWHGMACASLFYSLSLILPLIFSLVLFPFPLSQLYHRLHTTSFILFCLFGCPPSLSFFSPRPSKFVLHLRSIVSMSLSLYTLHSPSLLFTWRKGRGGIEPLWHE